MSGLVMLCVVAALVVTRIGVVPDAGESVATSEVRRLCTDFRFTEGPAWHPDGYLVFSDIPADTIYALKGDDVSVFRRPSGNSNGLAFDARGRLLACEHGNRRVSRTEAEGTVVPLAAHDNGKRLNSPNDLTVRSDGSVYFTDPPYGVRPEARELDYQGVYRVDPKGDLALLIDDFVKPNGLAFSPDEKTLYVADTERDWLRAFDVEEGGGLGNGRVFHRFAGDEPFRPDGMKVDVLGNVYVAGRGGVRVLDPKGRHLETISTPEGASNLAFGGKDGRTLCVTARTSVYAVDVRHPGAVVAGRANRAPDR